jgi:hypothetical protein
MVCSISNQAEEETTTLCANPKCDLINPRTTDQECFKYCMRFHQSPQTKHSDRITVLDKTEDKFDYGCMTFPPSLDDVK